MVGGRGKRFQSSNETDRSLRHDIMTMEVRYLIGYDNRPHKNFFRFRIYGKTAASTGCAVSMYDTFR